MNPKNQVAEWYAQCVGVGRGRAICGIWSVRARVEVCGLRTGSSGHFPAKGKQAAWVPTLDCHGGGGKLRVPWRPWASDLACV